MMFPRQRVLGALVLGLVASVSAAAAQERSEEEHSVPSPPAPGELFQAVVQAIPLDSIGHSEGPANLRVDPRPFVSEATLELASEDILATQTSEELADRSARLQTLGVVATDAIADRICGMSFDLLGSNTACEHQDYVTAILGQPRRGGFARPKTGESEEAPEGTWTTRVLSFSTASETVMDIMARQDESGVWQVIGVRIYLRAMI